LEEDLKKYTKEVQGREFFMYAIVEINKIWKSINTKTYYGLYDEYYIIDMQHEIEEIKASDDPDKEDQINTKTNENMIRSTNTYYKITKEKWNEIHDLSEIQKVKRVYEIFFNKYRYSLEIYFTNLSYMISYVKDKESVKQYIPIIQAQTLHFEKYIIFYHAIYCKEFRKLLIETNFLGHIDDLYLNVIDKNLNVIFRRYKNIGRRLAAINK
jgi:hypothetical protein